MRKDYTGHRFGQLTCLEFSRLDGKSYWMCRCDCGTIKEIRIDGLQRGLVVSCGCYNLEKAKKTKHGCARDGAWTPEYGIWAAIIARCTNKKNKRYKNYGGRGVKVCERWRLSFKDFLEDVGPRPTPEHSIGRKDNDGDYEPGNVEWQTDAEQRRNTTTSRILEHDGKRLTMAEWARELGWSVNTIMYRLRVGVRKSGPWSVTETLTIPPGTPRS